LAAAGEFERKTPMNLVLEDRPALEVVDRQPSRKAQLLEVLVFLFLVLPSMGLAYQVVNQTHLSFAVVAVSSLFSDLGMLFLVLYFVWRNDEPWARIGWTFNRFGTEVAWGALLFLPMTYLARLLEINLRAAGFTEPTKLPSFLMVKGHEMIGLACVLVTVVAIVEETIFRGYLLLRFQAVTGNAGLSVVLSSVIFALGHGYEGTAGMITIFFLGVIFALIYLWRRSLVAPIVMHFLQDFAGLVLVALMRGH
jgi:membrane protease YdiL (CAAX protease family)